MNDIKPISTKHCLICKGGQKNECLHWHMDEENSSIWVYCVGKCKRAYNIYEYTAAAGLSLAEFLRQDFTFDEARPNEVQKMDWPSWYLSLSDPRSEKGVEYLASRGIDLDDGMYYDYIREGIVFPYYYDTTFVGAQTRFIVPLISYDGSTQKMDTMAGTRLGLLWYGWAQTQFMHNVKGVIVTEGAFDALSIQQSLNLAFGNLTKNPWRAIACSGAGISAHQIESMLDLKNEGIKILIAPDSDQPGLDMLEKFKKAGACTHYALTMDDAKDWNSIAIELGKEEFAKFFLKSIKHV